MINLLQKVLAASSSDKLNPNGSDLQLSTIWDNVYNLAISLVGALIFIGIIVAGFQILTSGGDPSKAEKGKKTLLYIVIGGIIASISYSIYALMIKLSTGTI